MKTCRKCGDMFRWREWRHWWRTGDVCEDCLIAWDVELFATSTAAAE